ncbi:uncharacterized protein LOC105423903 [Pogonomyrmex barbatus]|uniref:Uncharacterized protein LOC105423903 n=1 Tax=Pogonomyrmex barbatus TaxID=144034 RepID=A0A6I9WK98_9HYME|nr:uncharacterized protein LOC105423903 [Pogonomyrmex barbatus]
MFDDEESQTHLLSLVPVKATVNLNTGHNNAHSVSLGASGIDGISLSESDSYNRPAGSPISVSKSVSAGLSGISTAGAKAYTDGDNDKTESHSFSFGQATATSFGVIENGQTITGAASSVGTSQSSATTGDNRGQSFSQAGAVSAQYPYRPTWNNVGPNNGPNDQYFNQPTFIVSRDETRPTLNIGVPGISIQEQKPTIHVSEWRPHHREFFRPSLSIEYQLHNSRNDPADRSSSFHVGSKDSKQGYYNSDIISDLAQTVGKLFDII